MIINKTQPLSHIKLEKDETDWLYEPVVSETKPIEVIYNVSKPMRIPSYTMNTDEYQKYIKYDY